MKNVLKSLTLYIVVSVIIITGIYSAKYTFGQIMSSGTYKIQTDIVNFGGNRSASGTYTTEDTSGEIATGDSASTNYKVKAGYQQNTMTYISVTAPSNVTLSPNIGGVSGGTALGSTEFTVVTDNPAGYTVTIQASSSPSLVSSLDSFADYGATVSSPDYDFSINSTASAFAFSPEGTDITSGFKDNGLSCAVGSLDTADKCWAGLSTSPQTFVNRTSANNPTGTVTTIKFRAQSGSGRVQKSGTYVSTTTITTISQ